MSESKSRRTASVLGAVAVVVCGVAAAVRSNVPSGAVHQGAEVVCHACEAAGVLLPDGGVVVPAWGAAQEEQQPQAPLERAPGRSVGVAREGGTWRPVLLQGVPVGRATVEELPEGEVPAFR